MAWIDRFLVVRLDVGAEREIVLIGTRDPEARRTNRSALLPVLRGERAHAVLILEHDGIDMTTAAIAAA
jgi:hypothetical protein